MADIFRRALDKPGKGGVHCYCCNPYASRRANKHRAKLSRSVRRGVIKRMTAADELHGIWAWMNDDQARCILRRDI